MALQSGQKSSRPALPPESFIARRLARLKTPGHFITAPQPWTVVWVAGRDGSREQASVLAVARCVLEANLDDLLGLWPARLSKAPQRNPSVEADLVAREIAEDRPA